MPVAERFVSINGEGPRAGRFAAFVRFAGCNLSCSYCDTRWACQPGCPVEQLSCAQIARWVLEQGVPCATLTGGEPLLQPLLPELARILLEQGIGDTMRLSLTADPVEEVNVAWDLLSSLGMRRLHPELVSCPTCGRCQVNLIGMADEVSKRLAQVKAPISVAVMGCVVNGPGESRDADLGIACGRGQGVLFRNGKKIRNVPEDQIVDELFREIEARYGDGIARDAGEKDA